MAGRCAGGGGRGPSSSADGSGFPLSSEASFLRVDSSDLVHVRVSSLFSSAVSILASFRLLSDDGQILESVESLAVAADTADQDFTFRLGLGRLVGALFLTDSEVTRGAMHLRAWISRDSSNPAESPSFLLVSGYIIGDSPIAWPGSPIESWPEGRGSHLVEFAAVPDPGLVASITQPSNVLWRIRGGLYSLVTSATAANRRAGYSFVFPNAANLFPTYSADLQVASTTFFYYLVPPGVVSTAFTQRYIFFPHPYDTVPGTVISSSVENIQADDQVASFRLLIEEFIIP